MNKSKIVIDAEYVYNYYNIDYGNIMIGPGGNLLKNRHGQLYFYSKNLVRKTYESMWAKTLLEFLERFH